MSQPRPWTRRQLLRAGSALAAVWSVPSGIGRQAADRVGARVVTAPTSFEGTDGRTYLAYELRLTAHREDLPLERVRVWDGTTLLLTYTGDDLDGRVSRPELPRRERFGRLIRRGTGAVLSVWLVVPPGRRPPQSLRHEFQLTPGQPAVDDLRVAVNGPEPLIFGRPVRSGLWLAHNGPGDHRAAHWGSISVQGETVTVPQRYAIDFIGLDVRGRGVRGKLADSANSDWVGFGAEVLAVADAVVTDVRDGIPDNPPLFEPGPPSSVELPSVGGNYVVLDVGGRRFVHYAHLERGSVAVRGGQRVTRGAVVGRLGNSGNTNGAHLHFNVVDGPLVREAQGLPYVFETVVSRGITTADAVFGEATKVPEASQPRRRVLPLNGAIIEFPP